MQPEEWLRIHEIWHQLENQMLYIVMGILKLILHRIGSFNVCGRLQDKTGFQTFIPL